jgi:hypothetical protein
VLDIDLWFYRRKEEKFNKKYQMVKNGKRKLVWSNPPIRIKE